MIRLFIYAFLIVIVLLIVLIGLAHFMENNIHEEYEQNFNDFRLEKGITPLSKFDNRTDIYWSDFAPDNPSTQWLWILTNEEIGTETSFYNDSVFNVPYHYSKTIFYGTHLFFWQNFYGGEIDTYLNPISKDTTLELTVVYYSADLEPGDFFYANIDTLYPSKPPIFFCGTPFLEDEKYVPKGNVSKVEADGILEMWKIKK